MRKSDVERTKPDYHVYVPGSFDGATIDCLNEHFLVFEGRNNQLMALWTQSPYPTCCKSILQKNRIVFSRSNDEGATWENPTLLTGSWDINDESLSNWAFPLVSDSGRIYVIYSRYTGKPGWIRMHTGIMEGIYSDDDGKSWSSPEQIIMPLSPYDDPTGEVPSEWIVWQKPIKDLKGNYFTGYTRWANPKKSVLKEKKAWTWIDSVCEFMRFTNIAEDPEVKDIKIEYSAWGEKSLKIPRYIGPNISVAQEPSLVRLPDDRLFCVMRSCTGYIWWSQSMDDGYNWTTPQPLLYKDFSDPILNSLSPDPIYRLSDGKYMMLFHHSSGRDNKCTINDEAYPRDPLYVSIGEFRPNAQQPLWFSDPKVFMSTDGICPDGLPNVQGNPMYNPDQCLSMYASFTSRNGEDILWYPERKFFLLGKKIVKALFEGMHAPN